MKHFGFFSLFFGCWLLAGCTADPGAEPGPSDENPSAAENPHAVPVEQALEELQSVLEEIDAPAEDGAATRSGGIRRVKSVTTVSPEALSPGGTRSEATTNVEDLLYIVNFEDEAGYAILGADDRLEPVYAVVDEGSLTTEDFRYAVTVTDEQAQADGKFVFPLQLVAQAALGGIGTGGGGNGIGGGPITDIGHLGPTWLGTTYSDWETQELQPTLVSTAWNQDAPYNNYLCPPTQEGNCVAGCVPIAVAQILVHNAVEYNKKFYQMGRKPIKKNIWFAIENAVKDPSLIRIADNEPMTTETHAVAYFINVMGEAVGAEYGAEETSASDGNVEKLFQYLTTIGLGYSNISLSAIDANKAREMVFTKILPFYFSGRSNTSGHAWVISGWLLRTRTATHRYANAPTQSQTEREQYVYCNFGWDRYYNGYYKFNVFNAAGGPELRTSSTDNYYYRNNLRAVTYDLTR